MLKLFRLLLYLCFIHSTCCGQNINVLLPKNRSSTLVSHIWDFLFFELSWAVARPILILTSNANGVWCCVCHWLHVCCLVRSRVELNLLVCCWNTRIFSTYIIHSIMGIQSLATRKYILCLTKVWGKYTKLYFQVENIDWKLIIVRTWFRKM